MFLYIVHLRVAHPKDGIDNRRYGIVATNAQEAGGRVLSSVNASFGRDHFEVSWIGDGASSPVRL